MLDEDRIEELAWVARSAGPDVVTLVKESIRTAIRESQGKPFGYMLHQPKENRFVFRVADTDDYTPLYAGERSGKWISAQHDEPASTQTSGTPTEYGRMIVARRTNGEVEAAGWDCAETRADAREWLRRGLVLEFVTSAQVDAIDHPLHVFSTIAPIGDVLTPQQAANALDGY